MDWRQQLLSSWYKPEPDAWAHALRPLSWVYRTLAWAHRTMAPPPHSSPADVPAPGQRMVVPTVVVGNWVVGGAGKTPMTLALLHHLQQRGWRPGVISRGHGRQTDGVRLVDAAQDAPAQVGDEPLLIARRARVPVCVGTDRRAAREYLLEARPDVDIVVSDDGLQHVRLDRDLNLIVVDERGAGNGLCLPAGPLREPIPDEVPARSLVVYSSGMQSLRLPGALARRSLTGVQPFDAWCRREEPQPVGWEALRGRPIVALAGIAAPQRFFDMLGALGLDVIPLGMSDHDPMDVRPWPEGTPDVVTTEKDAVKLQRWVDDRTRVWVARLDLTLDLPFWTQLDGLLPPRSG